MSQSFDRISIKKLTTAAYNPPKRTRDGRMQSLISSIERVGLIYPIAVTKDSQIIDGHRRLAACKELGWTEIPVIVVDGNQDDIYADVNATASKMSGNDALWIYLNKPTALTAHARARYEHAESVIGKPLLIKVQKAGVSLTVFQTAVYVARNADRETDDVIKQLVEWMLQFSNTGQVRDALARGTNANLIIAASERMKPIKSKVVIG